MSLVETVLIFVGIPAAVFAVIAVLVYGTTARRGKRYRPGQPFEFTPVWFLASADGVSGEPIKGARVALPAGSAPEPEAAQPKGGASATW